MTATTDDLAALHDQVRALADRADVIELFDRFARDLDERTEAGLPFDTPWAASYFADDARVDYPVGSAEGVEDLAARITIGMSSFRRTHHLTTNYVVDLDGDRATVRCNLLATHVHRGEAGDRFTVGDYYDNELVRTPAGWRIARQSLHVTWTDGTPPALRP